MVTLFELVFVSVTLTAVLFTPMAWLPKLIELGFTVTSARAGVLSANEAMTTRAAPKIFPLTF
jgi:hypothetical protein